MNSNPAFAVFGEKSIARDAKLNRKGGKEEMGDCPNCDGTGKIKCPHCDGTGYEPDDNDDLSIGGWIESAIEAVDDVILGPEKCSECDGDGEIDCPDCDGTGEA